MAQTIIKIKCTDQALEIIEAPVIASGGFYEDKLHFEFCPLWDGFTKTATFYIKKEETYYAELDSENTCIIPHEVLEKAGNVFFGVVGVNSDNITRTSEVLKYKIVQGAISENHKPSDPTPDIYEQILARLNSITTGGLIVDSALSPTSTNPIQNRAVYEALEGKASVEDVQGIQGNLETAQEDLEFVKNAVNSANNSIQEIETDITDLVGAIAEATTTGNEAKEIATENSTQITETNQRLDETKLSLEGHLKNTENPHNVTTDKIGALPIGGGTMTGDINMEGRKIFNLAAPEAEGDAVSKSYVDNLIPYVESTTYSGCFFHTVDGEMEWHNPPMVLDTEYRTTERYLGKAVYTKLIYFGELPNAGEKSVAHGGNWNVNPIRVTGFCPYVPGVADAISLPYTTGWHDIKISATSSVVCIVSKQEASAYSAYVQIWYTK